MTRVIVNPILNIVEKPMFNWLAARLNIKLRSWHATVIAVASSVMFLLLSSFKLNTALAALLMVHYVFDGVDGKIAMLNSFNPNGYLIDKTSDIISSVNFAVGASIALDASHMIPLNLTVLTIIHAIYLYLYFSKNIEVKIGGTEGRFALAALLLLYAR
ncbi:MAG: CDP-alcohol phosphatidyltransferase family protein [Candidatus Bathyarchaeota archaeon]|nr:CDP-alcohol phosphatidyltransferase family protein [Candidatus Bathyarchaeota archaeon]